MTKTAVVSCMRNEGPFLLEWIAYHRAIGFDDVIVITNDCTDGSDQMLDRLAQLGIVTHIRNAVSQGDAPQISGMRLAMAHPIVSSADWVLHIDADEFLNVRIGSRMVEELLEPNDFSDLIAVMWRAFGNSGKFYWRGGSVLSSFVQTQRRPRQSNAGHKSFFRPGRFGRCIDHMPKDPVSTSAICVNAKGDVISNKAIYQPNQSRFRVADDHLTWENACINHYAIRSTDIFLMKNDRGDGMANRRNKYFLNSNFFKRQNKNEVFEYDILEVLPRASQELNLILQDDEVRRLDYYTLECFLARRDEILTPDRIAEWTEAN